jgi:hypothetical protein
VRRINGLACFYAAWVCGVLGLPTGIDWLVVLGGALLIVAAVAVVARPDDPINRIYDRIPTGRRSTGIPQGRTRRAFVALVLGLIGVCWTVYGVVGVS